MIEREQHFDVAAHVQPSRAVLDDSEERAHLVRLQDLESKTHSRLLGPNSNELKKRDRGESERERG